MSSNGEYVRRSQEATALRERPSSAESSKEVARPRYMPRQEEWGWEKWAYRVEKEWRSVARNIQTLLGGAIGALLGITLAAVPSGFMDSADYNIALAQPVGAALGALIGGTVMLFVSRGWDTRIPRPPIH